MAVSTKTDSDALRRVDGWEQKLSAALLVATNRRFIEGTHDCCMMCADAVLAICGYDPAAAFRGKYQTAAGAVRALKKYGKGNLLATLDDVFSQFPEIPAAMAQRGDPVYAPAVLTPAGMAPAAGICVGSQVAFASDGLIHIPMLEITKVWAIR